MSDESTVAIHQTDDPKAIAQAICYELTRDNRPEITFNDIILLATTVATFALITFAITLLIGGLR